MDKIINMLINKKIKNNISQKDYNNLSKKLAELVKLITSLYTHHQQIK